MAWAHGCDGCASTSSASWGSRCRRRRCGCWCAGRGVSAGVAITIAVLAAVSHNFVWHERFTWPDLPREQRFKRWLSFHVSTGVISVLTNLGVTMLVMTATGLPVVPANVIAVAVASVANFWINDRLIFRPAPAVSKSGGSLS